MARKRVAVLISGRGSNMAALIEAAKDPRLSRPRSCWCSPTCRMPAGLTLAQAAGIATDVVDHKRIRQGSRRFRARASGRAREARDRDRLPRRFHAAPDADGSSANGRAACSTSTRPCCRHSRGSTRTRRALEAGVKQHGATVHFVVPEMDSGPIIAAGRGARCGRMTQRRRWRRACWRSNTASIRWR